VTTNASATIAEQAAAMHAGFAHHAPAHIINIFAQERATFAALGAPAAATAGMTLPDAPLLDVDGRETTLAAQLHGAPAVVVFYRGAWCPYCNITLKTYQTQLVPALRELGIALVAISPQKPDGSLTMAQKNELTFAVLSDPGNQLARKLGILSHPRSDEAAAASQALGGDIAATNIDGTADVPMPTAMLVNAAGTIAWIDVHADYATRTEVAEILAAARQMT
jgi:peroxiredoxin